MGSEDRRSRDQLRPPPILKIVGSSMEPTLGRGWRVAVDPISGAIEEGQVVVLRGAKHWIVHRIVHATAVGDEDIVFHRGDAATKVGWCSTRHVWGVVSRVVDPKTTGWSSDPPSDLRWNLIRCHLKCSLLAMALRTVGGARRIFGDA